MDGTQSPSRRADVERIDREPVTSSHIVSLGFEPRWSTLAVEFKDGSIWHYKDVPPDVAVQFVGAASIGSAYQSLIKGKYSAECMTGECPKCGDAPGIIGEKCADCGCDVYESACGVPHPELVGVWCRGPRRHPQGAHSARKGRTMHTWEESNGA